MATVISGLLYSEQGAIWGRFKVSTCMDTSGTACNLKSASASYMSKKVVNFNFLTSLPFTRLFVIFKVLIFFFFKIYLL